MVSSVSAREAELIDEIESRGMLFFTSSDAARFLDLDKEKVYSMLSRMKGKGLVSSVEQGKYVLTETLNSRDAYVLASNLVDGSYLGFFSALHFHGLTDQVPQKIQVVATKRKNNEVEIQGRDLEFITVRSKDFFGYERFGEALVSTPEKTVIDSLRIPGKSGDLSNIFELDFHEFDVGKLVDYAVKTGSSAVASRLGLLLETKNIGFRESKLKDLISHYSLFDPSRPKENPVNKWKIYCNREIS